LLNQSEFSNSLTLLIFQLDKLKCLTRLQKFSLNGNMLQLETKDGAKKVRNNIAVAAAATTSHYHLVVAPTLPGVS
jgi:hypothetical protein